MTVSVFELFSVGVGPSSSHTVGPMRAAQRFVAGLARTGDLLEVTRLEVDRYGSLAATGAGHGTLTAVLLGLEGHEPESISSETKAARIADVERTGRIRLGGLVELPFSANDIGCHPRVIRPRHPNAMELRASTRGGARLPAERYYSVGGGFVVTDDESDNPSVGTDVPFGYGSRRRDRPVPVGRGCDRRAHQIGASISGADVGCQGEVGSAAAMAAGALAEIRSAWWSAEAGR
ncbi:serine dehydratase beta chain [Gordonia hongkongensis]|uniref:serine dehydratase beta chain n=1 Tax=Gordonia hongkongensis TaxID=1701090 RepID=UPI003EBE9D56